MRPSFYRDPRLLSLTEEMSSKNAHAVSSLDSTARRDIFIAFLIAVTERLGEGKACLGSLAQSTMVGGRGGEGGLQPEAADHTCAQEAEGHARWCSAYVPLVIHPGTPVRGMMPPAFREGLPSHSHLSGDTIPDTLRGLSPG